jgi:hypothetical protein
MKKARVKKADLTAAASAFAREGLAIVVNSIGVYVWAARTDGLDAHGRLEAWAFGDSKALVSK